MSDVVKVYCEDCKIYYKVYPTGMTCNYRKEYVKEIDSNIFIPICVKCKKRIYMVDEQ